MRSDEQRYKTIGLMIFAVIIIFSVVGIVIIGFKMVKKNEEAKLVAAADTEYMKKQKQDIEQQEDSQEEKSTEESLNIEEFLDSATDSDKNTNAAVDSDTEVSEADAKKTALDRVSGATDKDLYEWKLDYDDGRPEYEGKIIYGGTEYEFTIDAATGSVMECDAEKVR